MLAKRLKALFGEGKGIIPIIRPDQIFFDRAHDALSIGIALGVTPASKYLGDAQKRAAHHEAI